MTQSQLETLKDELRAEILAELRNTQKTNNWTKLKDELEPRLNKFDTYNLYQILNAMSTIIRHSLGIKAIIKLQDNQVIKAREIALKVIDAMELNLTDTFN